MAQTVKTPVHLWIAGGLSLLWNAIASFDYTMTQTNNAAYLAALSPEQRAYFDSVPAWIDAAWGFGVLGGLFVLTLWQLVLADVKASDVMPEGGDYFTIVIWAIAIALLVYARAQRAKGVLR